MPRLIIILILLNFTFSYGQSILIPGEGILGDSIKINESTIFQAINNYGSDFEKTETGLRITYHYKSLGISFSINPYDSNRVIREMSFEFPYEAQTKSGVILNKTTWKELELQHGFKGGSTGGTYVYIPFDGGAYYLHKKPTKQGWNDNDTVFKIDITDKQANGMSKRINYVYNLEQEITSVEAIHHFVTKNPSLHSLTSHFSNPTQTFAPRLIYVRNRMINGGVEQSEIQVGIGETTYNINILAKTDTIFYLQARTMHTDSIALNYRNQILLTSCFHQHNAFYQTIIDTFNENSFIAKKIVYGFACGLAGIESVKRSELDFLLHNKDYQTISLWLRSMNPEIQAYGLEGIYKLYKSGIYPTVKDIEIMEYLVRKPIKIYACSGCIYGVDRHYADIVSPKIIRKMKKRVR